jgi:hypothetical protein
MSISSNTNDELLQENLENILKNAKKAQLKVFEDMVSPDEVMKIYDVIKIYIKKNRRKIYGGYGLNELLKLKNPEAAIYKIDPDNPKDIDFYTIDPICDFVNICNELHKAGFKFVMGQESLHRETYSIRVKNIEYCNISYVPKNIYNKLPFKEVDGYYYIHPHFMMIDMLRMFTDPLASFWRLPKGIYNRFVLLEKYYPLPQNINKKITVPSHSFEGEKTMNIILDFLTGRESTVTIGYYVYNYYIYESRVKYDYVNIPYYEIISTDYKNDVLELLERLKQIISPEKIRYEEYYPFFQFIGYSTNIYIENELIAKIYHNNNKCIPFIDVKPHVFASKKIIPEQDSSKFIKIGTFHLTCLYILSNMIKARVNEEDKDIFYIALSHVIYFRNVYLKDNKKNIFDKTIFEEFVINCVGITISNQMEKKLLIKQRKEAGKRYVIRYDPADKIIEPFRYIFPNSSGNKINKQGNFKISNDVPSTGEEDDDSHTKNADECESNVN